MEHEKELDLLKKVARADAPPFLLARVEAKIRAAETAERLPDGWKLAGGLAFAALVFLNIFLAKKAASKTEKGSEPIAVSLKITASNQFYDE